MLKAWIIVIIALIYIGLLFVIASWGDRSADKMSRWFGRANIYAFSLAVFCTSWTFFGSVGTAAANGLDFIAIYLGPIILFTIGYPLIKRVIHLSKSERIASISDFISARYGKSQGVATLTTLIAIISAIPYIALQLKAVSASVEIFVGDLTFGGDSSSLPLFIDLPFLVALSMAAFAILFGTRHLDATEHQEGLVLAIAVESLVKLMAFLCVGFYVTFIIYDGWGDLTQQAKMNNIALPEFGIQSFDSQWLTMIALSFFAALLLPRQFHVMVVECHSEWDIKRARWLFPLYLIAINIFVAPIAVAGLVFFGTDVSADQFVLHLPIAHGASFITLLAFIGGLSAATAMVIVACVALAIMVSNDIAIPLLLRRSSGKAGANNAGRIILNIRRGAIFALLMASYVYYRMAGDSAALVSMGLLSLAAIAQCAPAFLGGMIWRRATARGAIAGMISGFIVWVYTMLLPTFVASGLIDSAILSDGLFGLKILRPEHLFGLSLDPLTHGVFCSLTANLIAYIGGSLTRKQVVIEQLQTNAFVQRKFIPTPAFLVSSTPVTVTDLQMTVARYLGSERTERSFLHYQRERNIALQAEQEADIHLLCFAEQLLASSVGAASARLILSLLLRRQDTSSKASLKLLDDATAAIQYNRDLLQTALNQVRQGISVYDKHLRLICWNKQFRSLLGLPSAFGKVGASLSSIIRYNAARGEFGNGDIDEIVQEQLSRVIISVEPFQQRMMRSGLVLELRTSPMPDGGIVMTYTDMTNRVEAAEALAAANENLERRVGERTEELTRLNEALEKAKLEADAANLGKTRFLAAAGHDILQPLNAARLYVTTLVERQITDDDKKAVEKIDASLEAVEEVLGAVLDISRLDTGALKPEIAPFCIREVLEQIKVEFEPLAYERELILKVMPCSLTVRSDRRLLRRLLSNLVSNAIKYTLKGKILVGVRRKEGTLRLDVYDTGTGITEAEQSIIFQEFQRLDAGARVARGLGLGLSIVERIARVLNHPIDMESRLGVGSRFSVALPITQALPTAIKAESIMLPAAKLTDTLICCIDNEPKILDGMESLLEGWGCHVVTAVNSREASENIQSLGKVPNALLIDFHLHEGNGIDAIAQLRWRFGGDIPAVLITADRSSSIRVTAREKSISILHKPLKPAALRALLSQWKTQDPTRPM